MHPRSRMLISLKLCVWVLIILPKRHYDHIYIKMWSKSDIVWVLYFFVFLLQQKMLHMISSFEHLKWKFFQIFTSVKIVKRQDCSFDGGRGVCSISWKFSLDIVISSNWLGIFQQNVMKASVKTFYTPMLKGTLIQICSSSCKNPQDSAFLILKIISLFIRKVYEMFVYKHTETIEYVQK